MYDWETDSRWASVTGKAIVGALEGSVLTTYPATQTSWAAWLKDHPDTKVLKKPPIAASHYKQYDANRGRLGIHGRILNRSALPAKDKIAGFRLGLAKYAIPIDSLEADRVYQPVIGGVPLLVHVDGSGQGVTIWERRSAGHVYEFKAQATTPGGEYHTGEGLIFDSRSRQFSAGEQLPRIQVTLAYWFGWNNFYPDAKIVRPD